MIDPVSWEEYGDEYLQGPLYDLPTRATYEDGVLVITDRDPHWADSGLEMKLAYPHLFITEFSAPDPMFPYHQDVAEHSVIEEGSYSLPTPDGVIDYKVKGGFVIIGGESFSTSSRKAGFILIAQALPDQYKTTRDRLVNALTHP